MFEFVTDATLAEYEAFNASHPYGHFMQSKKWANLKNMWKWEAVIVRGADGKIQGSLALLIRNLPKLPFTLMYGCRGPVCDLDDRETFGELIAGARELAKKHHSYVLKLDPDVVMAIQREREKTPEEESSTKVPMVVTEVPEGKAFAKMLEWFGFRPASDGKNFEGIQPNFVYRLNVDGWKVNPKTAATTGSMAFDLVRDDLKADDAVSHFDAGTRNKVRKSLGKGVQIKICGNEMMPYFAKIMLETGLRDGFVTRPQSYFEDMMNAMGENARLYIAFYEDKPIAGTLAIYYGDKVWYLYGASANEARNVMPNYLLQWSMIQWALEKNCRIYDFRGVTGDIDSANPLFGLYRFKKGFNGDLCQFIGEYDLVFNKPIYFAYNKAQKVFRNIRRKRFLKKNADKDTSKPKNLTGDHRGEKKD